MKVWIFNYGNILGKGNNPRLLSYYTYLEKQGHNPCFCFVKKNQTPDHFTVIQNNIFHLAYKVLKGKPDLVYVYSPNIIFLPIYIASKLLGIPLVIEKTELDSIKPIENWKDYINKVLYKLDEIIAPTFARTLIVISDSLCKRYAREYPTKSVLIGAFLPYHAQTPSRVQRNYTLGYLGSFGRKDDVEAILELFIDLKKTRTDVQLKCIGNVTDAISSKWSETGVDFLGEVQNDQIIAGLADCQILLALRKDEAYSHYGFPSKLTEYLASGRPVITSSVSDIPALFQDKQELCLIAGGDRIALRKTVEWLLDHPGEAETIGSTGQAWALSNWDTEKVLSDWLNHITKT